MRFLTIILFKGWFLKVSSALTVERLNSFFRLSSSYLLIVVLISIELFLFSKIRLFMSISFGLNGESVWQTSLLDVGIFVEVLLTFEEIPFDTGKLLELIGSAAMFNWSF